MGCYRLRHCVFIIYWLPVLEMFYIFIGVASFMDLYSCSHCRLYTGMKSFSNYIPHLILVRKVRIHKKGKFSFSIVKLKRQPRNLISNKIEIQSLPKLINEIRYSQQLDAKLTTMKSRSHSRAKSFTNNIIRCVQNVWLFKLRTFRWLIR